MYSLCRNLPAIAAFAFALPLVAEHAKLRFCVDPNNMPLSNEHADGFENRIAALVARDLGADAEFVWWSPRRGYVRNTLKADRCDVLGGVPEEMSGVLTTRPYYRSTYVFVTRTHGPAVAALEDPVLAKVRVGVPIVGEDYAPPAYALAKRGVVDNIVPFTQYGAFGEADPHARIIEALARKEIDVAIVWGPTAGYFAARQTEPLTLTPVPPSKDLPELPFSYGMSLAVKPGAEELRDRLDAALKNHAAEIRSILEQFGVPLVRGAE
jgi:mxaJ protein